MRSPNRIKCTEPKLSLPAAFGARQWSTSDKHSVMLVKQMLSNIETYRIMFLPESI